jgi:phage terminase large subunit GpA-like protein
VLYVYPDEDTATENAKDRIIPMITKSSSLKSYLTGSGDDEGAKRIGLQHMQIYMAWARSAIKLGNKSIKYVVFDETDKYPDTANKREADPISLGEARVTTYRWGYKIWKISTPTIENGPIWKALTTEAQVVFDYWARCPKCKTFQVMEFKQIKWPTLRQAQGDRKTGPHDDWDYERIEAENLAHYECVECKAEWNDHMRDRAVRLGQWRSRENHGTQINTDEHRSKERVFVVKNNPENPENLCPKKLAAYLKQYRPHKIGFHIPSWLSRFIPLSRVAAAFLAGLGDKNKLKDFNNKHCALPWLEYKVERKEDRVLMLRDERPMGLVPGDNTVSCLTAGVDTQDNGYWYEVRAWGWGMTLESWQVRAGFVDSFEALEKILF